MSRSKDTAAIATYGDHEVITPENKLRGAVSKEASDASSDDPVARAEKALAELSPEFGSWMDSECDRLDKARRDLLTGEAIQASKDALFHAAHDIKGEAATFGYPAVASAANSLCRLIELTPESTCIPSKLIDQHVDAMRAIHREYARSDAKKARCYADQAAAVRSPTIFWSTKFGAALKCWSSTKVPRSCPDRRVNRQK